MSIDADTLDLVVTTDPTPNRADEAGIERAVMRRLGVAPGEYVAVEGRDRTVASVSRANVDVDGVALGPAVRENAAVDPGDRVRVAKTRLEPASQVTVAPTSTVAVQEGEVPLARALAGRPISTGDAVDAPLLEGALSLPFVVTDTVPEGPVLLTEQTTVLVRDEPVREDRPASVTFDDVGGLEGAMDTLCESITSPLTEPERFER
ncbi:MAG: hypothetical protein ACOC2A_02550, partial [Halanaeroarchaeum sp.]